MTLEQVLLGLLGMVTGGITWFARQLWDRHTDVEKQVHDLKVDIGTNYIRYDRLHDAIKPIMEALQEIKETLKTKADK